VDYFVPTPRHRSEGKFVGPVKLENLFKEGGQEMSKLLWFDNIVIKNNLWNPLEQ
jgi:hypothetical protein